MTCILLNETHIGADHGFLDNCLPHRYSVDLSKSKIHVDPDKKFIFAITGSYDEAFVKSDVFLNSVRYFISHVTDNEYTKDKLNGIVIKKDSEKKLNPIFDNLRKGDGLLIVTNRHRWYTKIGTVDDDFVIKYLKYSYCDKYFGMGSGGDYGVGLLRAGVPLEDIFTMVNKSDKVTSSAHTIIPLSILKD